MQHPSPSAQAVMLHMRDGSYHTMHAFPFIERALKSVSPSDLHVHLDATHDTLPQTSRSFGVWARYPLLEMHRALDMGVELHTYELAAATWEATQPLTRDLVCVAALLYGDSVKNAHMVPFTSSRGYGMHATKNGRTGASSPEVQSAMDSLNALSADAAAKVPVARSVLSELPYPRAYTEWVSAELSMRAAASGVPDGADFTEGISLALEVVPHFTVEGVPVTELLDAALDTWLRPLHFVGLTWEQTRAHEHNKQLGGFAALGSR